jgi:hypothetical protein
VALVNVGPFLWPDPNRQLGSTTISTSTNFQINGSGQRLGYVFCVPRSGTCTRIGVRISNCASAVTSRLGLYTVDGSGHPTSTLYGGSNFGTFTPAVATYSEVTLGAAATMTQGDMAAIVLEFDSTAGDMFVSCQGGTFYVYGLGYTARFNGTSWAKQVNGQTWFSHLYYSDDGGTYPDIACHPFTAIQATGTYNLNTAGADEYAIKIAPPAACRVAGIWHNFATAAGANYEAILYDGTTAERTEVMDGDHAASTAINGARLVYFPTGYTVAAGQTIRAAIRPTTTTNVTWRRHPLFAAGAEQSLGLPQGTCESTRVDLGAWSDTSTNLPSIGLILDQIDDGASAGGGLLRHPGMGGGING